MGTTAVTAGADDVTSLIFSGRYRALRRIGEGGLGVVYEVRHVQMGRRFALKALRHEHRSSECVQARFRQEARVGGLLSSPWTVGVLDYDVCCGVPYFVMDYLEGESLESILAREGQLCAARAVRLIAQACRGVAAAHAHGVLHRDLKPSNLFVESVEGAERCRVLDFGVAKADKDELATDPAPTSATGSLIGTLAYMPAEQVRGEELDARADVYALCAILYECLAGKRPFAAPAHHALMYQILEQRPLPLRELRPELPRELTDLVERGLDVQRSRRPAEASELRAALDRVVPSLERTSDASAADWAVGPGTGGFGGVSLQLKRRNAIALVIASGTVGFLLGRVASESSDVLEP